MNFKQIFRVAVSATIIALSVIGVGLLPVRAAAIEQFISFQQKLVAADAAFHDNFGHAVALESDTLVVGTPYDDIGANPDQGSAYVFTRSGGVWTFQQKLTVANGGAYDYFGSAVALSGDTLVVGAWANQVGTTRGQGSAYVFTRSGGVWTIQQKLTANDGAYADYFGYSVALSGDTVVVGANGDQIGTHHDQGSAYVFTRSFGIWMQQQKLTANDGGTNDQFGNRVALSGNTLVVAATTARIGANTEQGSVYVFTRTGPFGMPPHWVQQQKLIANDGAKDDLFGYSVALSGNTLVVGALRNAVGANVWQGSAYVFTRNGMDWTQRQKLAAYDGAVDDQFGSSVAIDGDTLVVGAFRDSIGANAFQGSAYIFTRTGEVWDQQQKLIAYDGETYDEFGYSVALSGDTVMVSARGDSDTIPLHGAVYVFNAPSNPTIMLQPEILPDGMMGMLYSEALTATGGTAPYRFVAQSPLPPGLVLNTPGVLSGMPTEDGTFRFRVQVIDANGYTSDCESAITIAKSGD